MKREEAICALGLVQGCSDEELRAKWSELCSRNRQKLAVAADHTSMIEYQSRLDFLNQIAAILWPLQKNKAVDTQSESQPQATSVVVPDSKRNTPLSLTQMLDLPAPTPIPIAAQGSRETPSIGRLDTGPVEARMPVESGEELASGMILADRYVVQRQLGSGGMGVVYAVEDRVRHESIALKVLRPELLRSPEAQDRFREEAKLASNLSHSGLVRVYDMWQTGSGLNFLTMELLQGRSLRDEIKQRKESNKRFTADEVREIGRQLCEALSYVHQRNVVHRDVKPENIWLCEDGTIKLMDFGIARLLTPSRLLTTNMALGTAYYMAPEQLRGEEQIDHRADQYALAVVLYELLTDQLPQGAVRAPSELRKSHPQPLSDAVMKGLGNRPNERHATMAKFSDAILRSSPLLSPWVVVGIAIACLVLLVSVPLYWTPLTRYAIKAMAGLAVEKAETSRQQAKEAQGKWESHAKLQSLVQDHFPQEVSSAEAAWSKAEQLLVNLDYTSAIDQFDSAKRLYTTAIEAADAAQSKQLAEREKGNFQQTPGAALSPRRVQTEALMQLGSTTYLARDYRLAKQNFDSASSLFKTIIDSTPEPFDATGGPGESAAKQAQKQWADFFEIRMVKEVSVANLELKLVLIPPGQFMMGTPLEEDARDRDETLHRVILTRPYWLGRTEVTQGQWKEVMKTEPWKGKIYVRDGADYAASYVSWHDAVAFCNRLSELEGKPAYYQFEGDEVTARNNGGYRLPTNAEWEYACRAGTRTAWSFGDDESELAQYAWYHANAWDMDEKYAHRVGQKRSNGYGPFDMHGNVWEWCWDWSGKYPEVPTTDPIGPRLGSDRVLRGGGWRISPRGCRSGNRDGDDPSFRSSGLGFRLALSAVE